MIAYHFQSDTFADGEKPESPAPHVGEVLSRGGSPGAGGKTVEDAEERQFTPPVADSPRERESQPAEEHFDVEALEEEILSPEQDREALVEMYHVSQTSLLFASSVLYHKISFVHNHFCSQDQSFEVDTLIQAAFMLV